MNGRIYDPLLGRFLSADLMVSNPGSLQSYNRYSYVGNNPLSNIDPSGFESAADKKAREEREEADRQAHNRAVERWIAGAGAPAPTFADQPNTKRLDTQAIYVTSKGWEIPLAPGALTGKQISNIPMDSADGATILRLLGKNWRKFGTTGAQARAARIALLMNQGPEGAAAVGLYNILSRLAPAAFASIFSGGGGSSDVESSASEMTTAYRGKMTTVLGSMRDIDAFKRTPTYLREDINVLEILNYGNMSPEVVNKINTNFMNGALIRGDDFWLMTDPVIHRSLMLEKGFQSNYINLEIPMLESSREVRILPQLQSK